MINDENLDAQGMPWMCDTIQELVSRMMHYLPAEVIEQAFEVLAKDGFFVWSDRGNPGGKLWYTLSPKCWGSGERPS